MSVSIYKVIKKPKIDDKIKWATSEEAPIPSRGEPGLHEAAAESIGPQETSSVSTVNNSNSKIFSCQVQRR